MTRIAKIPTSVDPYTLVHNMTKAELLESIRDIKRVTKQNMPIVVKGKAMTKQEIISLYGIKIVNAFKNHRKVKGENVRDINQNISESQGWFAPISIRPRVFNARPPTTSNVKYTPTNVKNSANVNSIKKTLKTQVKKASAKKPLMKAPKKVVRKSLMKPTKKLVKKSEVKKAVSNIVEKTIEKAVEKSITPPNASPAKKILIRKAVVKAVTPSVVEPTVNKIMIKNAKDIRRINAGKKAYETRVRNKAVKGLTTNIFANVIEKAKKDEEMKTDTLVKNLTADIFKNVIAKQEKPKIMIPVNRAAGRPPKRTTEKIEARQLELAIDKRLSRLQKKNKNTSINQIVENIVKTQ